MAEFGFWLIQGPGWALVLYLIWAQCLPALRYDLGVRWGTQEPASQITEVGVAFWWAFAFADLVLYTPLLALGLWGHAFGFGWGALVLAAALGITCYWPLTSLAAVWAARSADGWELRKERDYWIVLPLLSFWGLAGLIVLLLAA
ncbi:hypothetical protein [Aestuariicoccus sp. MJ-SS9]|uniref:hypothetical protein n=1 Tax=Aestuariicoccus sp. MJ-SS9 TaxID=3079855 RepID=UPI002909312E|nr:hypothetical protein [Aestuariicoccus sp. MJ-SS9]MDU8911164.1 hypothetical protein [Aestuariicoccus sp. MJ-SS9]